MHTYVHTRVFIAFNCKQLAIDTSAAAAAAHTYSHEYVRACV